jgi:hypothetical protein
MDNQEKPQNDANTAPINPAKTGPKSKNNEITNEFKVREIAAKTGFGKLTKKQVAWLVAYLNCEPEMGDTAVAHEAGVDIRSAAKWWKRPAWTELVWRCAVAREQKHLGKVWRAARQKAESGDLRAIALYTQRFDPEFIQLKGQQPMTEAEKATRNKALSVIRDAAKKRNNQYTKAKTS